MAGHRSSRKPPGLRIIGGSWRGRRLDVPDRQGLRPTPDRIRETLFNWLGQSLHGLRVLDCCAGAGGLGFEAASRGALAVTMVESARDVATHLTQQARDLEANQVTVIQADIMDFLQTESGKFDLAFVDPPYARPELRLSIVDALIDNALLNPGARIYVEWPRHENCLLSNHARLSWLKRKQAGQVEYAIAQWF